MKKLLQTAAVILACVSFAGGMAAADSISNTGPGSSNTIDNTITNVTDSNCDNNVNVNTSNLQNAQSGDTDVTGNTQAGGAITGDSSNFNDSTFNVQTGCGTLATSTTTPPPATGGKGAEPTPAPTAKAVTVSGTLPETGSNLPAIVAASSVAVAAVALSVSRLGLAAYRRLSL